MKWIAVQLAEQDEALCKNLESCFPNDVDEINRSGFTELWKLLKIGGPSSQTTNYLIFDDVDKFPDSALQ